MERPRGSITASTDTAAYGDVVAFSFEGEEVADFNWEFDDATHSIEENPAHYFYSEGHHTVSLDIESSLGCTNSLQLDTTVFIYDQEIDVASHADHHAAAGKLAGARLSVYPIPATDHLNIDVINGNAAGYQATLYDMTGQQVRHVAAPGNMDLSGLPGGTYLLRIQTHETKTINIIKN